MKALEPLVVCGLNNYKYISSPSSLLILISVHLWLLCPAGFSSSCCCCDKRVLHLVESFFFTKKRNETTIPKTLLDYQQCCNLLLHVLVAASHLLDSS